MGVHPHRGGSLATLRSTPARQPSSWQAGEMGAVRSEAPTIRAETPAGGALVARKSARRNWSGSSGWARLSWSGAEAGCIVRERQGGPVAAGWRWDVLGRRGGIPAWGAAGRGGGWQLAGFLRWG